jgi:hypothetical protein
MAWLAIALLAAQLYAVDLAAIQQEPNLERRSDLALQYASSALDTAREAYTAGDIEKTQAAFQEVGSSVDLAYDSLGQTGKDPRRSPKFFKRAEMSTRQLLRRLDGMMESMSVADRALIEKVRGRVADVHENLLKGIMSKKK